MRLKKFLGITLALGMIISVLPANVYAAENVKTNNVSDEEFDLTKQTGYMGTVKDKDFKPLPSDLKKNIKSNLDSNVMSAAVSEGEAY